MTEKEYYQVSTDNHLPHRCPILNYCSRRAWTIYLFSEYSKFEPLLDFIQALQKDGVIPNDFEQNQILLQGEQPSIIRGNDHFYFTNVCPEVNLFDDSNALIPDQACVEGTYDKHYKSNKKRAIKSQHFSKCAEFNKYVFDNGLVRNRNGKTKRKSIPYKTKSLLQKEINSICPFCANPDVEHFHVHHIDENPSNNSQDNLIMLCPNCHSKITKGDIPNQEVIDRKKKLKG